jgi:hypothetical protein
MFVEQAVIFSNKHYAKNCVHTKNSVWDLDVQTDPPQYGVLSE